ncbi:glycogen synthase GlgA [Halalkalibacter akibai]|uniref:Glycogen synthase n=1 Tax=Halalkalibacter akibai (strain ATCC 43226 / DSM 21942 / CIP 109018 / JCM 9157 / 1139) TaxID=1236973 RepID=W4QVH2_HALA3|nr:glycogen synthase GlgA [Halalkalibacter akibai]GAE35623.1 glycogen synthase [Halalkalibacter akibai JCM 9157]
MNIVMVASECAPFFKTGGLADVVASLPKALTKKDHHLKVFIPKHRCLPSEIASKLEFITSFTVHVKWREQYCGLFKYEAEGVTYYFIDNQYYFDRLQMYGEMDDAERYTYFTHAFFKALDVLEVDPDFIHCHDWPTALIPLYTKAGVVNTKAKTVFTIHNLKYQGIFPLSVFDELLHLDRIHLGGLEYEGAINFMKAALIHADWVTTVSPSYAQEIMDPYFGEGLEAFLHARNTSLTGIVNGIDEDVYNPATDLYVSVPYKKHFARKKENKRIMQQEFDLTVSKEIPMFVLISRLVEEKGLPLLVHILDELLTTESVQVVIMGTGETRFEEHFQEIANRYPNSCRFMNVFQEGLARRLYASSDFFLMPSRFEPCGLSQLIALRYESVPIVRETGGLKDTIVPYNEYTGEGNGFSFTNYNADDFLNTIRYAIHLYHQPRHWNQILKNVYKSKLNWEHSAAQYENIYMKLLNPTNKEDPYVIDSRSTEPNSKREAHLVIR